MWIHLSWPPHPSPWGQVPRFPSSLPNLLSNQKFCVLPIPNKGAETRERGARGAPHSFAYSLTHPQIFLSPHQSLAYGQELGRDHRCSVSISQMSARINTNENRYWALTSSSLQSSRAGTPIHYPHTPSKQGTRCTCGAWTSRRSRGMQAWPLSSPGKGQSSACLLCPATAPPSQFWQVQQVGAAGGH